MENVVKVTGNFRESERNIEYDEISDEGIAMSCVMKVERDLLLKNETWELVNLPLERKAIGILSKDECLWFCTAFQRLFGCQGVQTKIWGVFQRNL